MKKAYVTVLYATESKAFRYLSDVVDDVTEQEAMVNGPVGALQRLIAHRLCTAETCHRREAAAAASRSNCLRLHRDGRLSLRVNAETKIFTTFYSLVSSRWCQPPDYKAADVEIDRRGS